MCALFDSSMDVSVGGQDEMAIVNDGDEPAQRKESFNDYS